MKHIYLLMALFAFSFSNAQPLVGQPTGPGTASAPDVGMWSNLDYWNILNYVSVVNAMPGNANMPVLFWGDQGLVSAGTSLNSYLSGYVPTTRTINGSTLSSNLTGVGIELPSQSGQSGKFLSTNGTSVSWTAAPFSYSAPSSATSITSGTAFQPRSGGACNLNVNSQMTGLLGVTGTVTIALSATSGGTYTTVATDTMLLSVAGITLDRSSPSISVPAGYWVRVTYSGTGTLSGTYTRTDIN